MRFHGITVVVAIVYCASACGPRRAEQPTPVVVGNPLSPGASAAAPAEPTAPASGTSRHSSGSAKPSPKPAAGRTAADSLRLESAFFRERSHAPLARVLSRRSGNEFLADRVAAAVLRESRRVRLSPSFVAAVLLIENTPMDTTAVSVAGAVGLMQVMPVHEGGLGCPTTYLYEVEANICHGTRLLRMYLRRNRTVEAALRRYNGCVGALVTRNCLRYPSRVLRTAASIRRELLAMPPEEPPLAAAPPRGARRIPVRD